MSKESFDLYHSVKTRRQLCDELAELQMSERNCPACGGSGYTSNGAFTEHHSSVGTSPCYLCNSSKQRLLTGDEESALSKALNRSTKKIKRPITKADADEYCKANGLVVIPEEPFNEALNILKKVRDGELGNCNAYRDLIAAYKEQAF